MDILAFTKIPISKTITYLTVCTVMLTLGLLTIFMRFPDLFLSLSTIKLCLLAVSITFPPFLIILATLYFSPSGAFRSTFVHCTDEQHQLRADSRAFSFIFTSCILLSVVFSEALFFYHYKKVSILKSISFLIISSSVIFLLLRFCIEFVERFKTKSLKKNMK